MTLNTKNLNYTRMEELLINEFKAPSIRGTLAGAQSTAGGRIGGSSGKSSVGATKGQDPNWTPAQNKEINTMVGRAKGRRATEIAGRFVGGSPHGTPLGTRPGSGLAGRRTSSPWSAEPSTGSQGQLDAHRRRDREIHKAINKSAKEIADSPDPEKDSGYFQQNAFNRPSAANRSELDIERMRSSRQSKTAKISQDLSRPERGDSNQDLLDKTVKNTPNPQTYRGPGDTVAPRSGVGTRGPRDIMNSRDATPTERATAWRQFNAQKDLPSYPTSSELRHQADRTGVDRPGAGKVHRQHKDLMAKRDAREKQASSDEKNRMAHVDQFDPNLLRQQQLDRVSDVMKRTKAAKDKINLNDLPNINHNTNRRLGYVDKTRPKTVRDPRKGPQPVYSRGIGDQLRNYYRNVIREPRHGRAEGEAIPGGRQRN